MSVYIPAQPGGTISASDSDSISTELSSDGLPPGTKAWNADVGEFFKLTVSTASLVTDEVLAVLGITGLRWIKDTVANAEHADVADTADAPTDATTFTAALNTGTRALKGLVGAGERSDFMRQGVALGDADTTIEPFNDKCALYILPAATLTANRVLTVGHANQFASYIVRIVVQDLTANTYTIKDDAGNTLYTKTASPTQARTYELYMSGGTAHFVQNGTWWSP